MDPELHEIEHLRLAQEYDAAVRRIQHYLRNHPDDPDGHDVHGIILREMDQPTESLAAFERALNIAPAHAIKKNFAMSLLHCQKWAPGWAQYESRFKDGSRTDLPGIAPWDGRTTPGLRLLVWQEQGQGDTIQFARLLPMLAARGVSVTLKCSPELGPLMEVSMRQLRIDRVITDWQQTAALDAHIPILSLPHVLKAYEPCAADLQFPYLGHPGSFPSDFPTIPAGKRPIAIAWACKSKSPDFSVRSCPIQHFEALAARKDLHLYSVQVGHRDSSDATWLEAHGIPDLSAQLPDYRCTASALLNASAVVTVDTSIAHLAGALNIPTLILLRFGADWRWHEHTATTSPWYPSVRLVRQTQPNNWGDVLHRASQCLNEAPFL